LWTYEPAPIAYSTHGDTDRLSRNAAGNAGKASMSRQPWKKRNSLQMKKKMCQEMGRGTLLDPNHFMDLLL